MNNTRPIPESNYPTFLRSHSQVQYCVNCNRIASECTCSIHSLAPSKRPYHIPIDEEFIDTIIMLNAKGYATQGCCSGAIIKEEIMINWYRVPYIQFGVYIPHSIIPPVLKQFKVQNNAFDNRVQVDLPKTYLRQFRVEPNKRRIDYTYKEEKIQELEDKINELRNEIKNWACNLPLYKDMIKELDSKELN